MNGAYVNIRPDRQRQVNPRGRRFRPHHTAAEAIRQAVAPVPAGEFPYCIADGEALGPDVQLHPLLHRRQINDGAALVLHRQTGCAVGQGDARTCGGIIAGKLRDIVML